ncbi:MAG: DUF169 domain-containing protein [Candidatus Brocadiia bacterium]
MDGDLMGVSFVRRPVDGWPVPADSDKYCAFIGRARRGERFCVPAENISCPLARFHLGVGRTSLDELADTLVGWGDAADRQRGLRFLEEATRLQRDFSHIAFFPTPVPGIAADLLVLACQAETAQPIVRRHTARTARPIHSPVSGVGAACGECTAYVLERGEPVVSLGCGGSRPAIGLAPGEVLISAPQGTPMYDTLGKQA